MTVAPPQRTDATLNELTRLGQDRQKSFALATV